MSAFVVEERLVFTVVTCWSCGVKYGMPASLLESRKRDGESLYCPNGHAASYSENTDAAKLKRAQQQLEQARVRETALRDQRDAADRTASAYKGQVTRIKKRVGNGVCPCCKRSFADLRRHMGSKHPDFADSPA